MCRKNGLRRRTQLHVHTDAYYDKGIPFFGENFFRMTGLLNPKSSEIRRHFVFFMVPVVSLGHGIFRSVAVSYIFLSSKSVFRERS